MSKQKQEKISKRRKRVRSKIVGSKDRPRLSVFRSNEHIYAQVVDDTRGITLVSAGDSEVKGDKKTGNTESTEIKSENTERGKGTAAFNKSAAGRGVNSNTLSASATGQVDGTEKRGGTEKGIIENTERMQKAYKVGELIAKKAAKKKIKSVVFDRGGYKYHGRVAALADGARKGGLKF